MFLEHNVFEIHRLIVQVFFHNITSFDKQELKLINFNFMLNKIMLK